MGDLVVFEDELELIGRTLTETESQLLAVADQRRVLLDLLDGCPFPAVSAATADFVTAYELALWDAAGELGELGQEARRAAAAYDEAERHVYGGVPSLLPPPPVWARQ